MSHFDRIHDTIVLTANHAGIAAARRLRAAGQDVLLLDAGPALLPEAGWSFADDAGGCDDPSWRGWLGQLQAKGAAAGGRIDPGSVEGEMADLLIGEGLPVLLYAVPVAVELADGLLAAVTVATKAGLRRLAARRWLDAGDGAQLATLCGATAPAPERQRLHIILRRAAWAADAQGTIGAGMTLEPTRWECERRLAIELPGATAVDHAAWLPALAALRGARDCAEAVVTHGSVVPLGRWAGGWKPQGLPANLALATPAIAGGGWSLGGRWAAGLAAAERLRSTPQAAARLAPVPALAPVAVLDADVAVIGAGTGGALAAIAAARAGARTIAIEPLPFAGGIGSGGGIHSYYWGVRGGMQEEVDARVRTADALFGTPGQIRGFHPDAKKAVLAQMLHEAGAELRTGCQLAAVERAGRRIAACAIATAGAPLRLAARAWIDGTGDGDLCALAGAAFRKGRAGDGLLHAFTQSCGRAQLHEGRVRMQTINFDAGFCDPTDPADLSRARLAGCALLAQVRYDEHARPNGVSPALGLRQGRHIETLATVTLDDQITGRRFADAVGSTGANYDNHATDLEFEADEAAFWVWACRGWPERLWCEIPYGCMVPRDLDDTWIASRCLGVSESAHHSLRMQRDLQRLGEVAGLAAAAALRQGAMAAAIDLEPVRAGLRASGALSPSAEETAGDFGTARGDGVPQGPDDLASPVATYAMWRRWRAGAAAVPELLPLLGDPRPIVAWRAAAILGALGDARAEPRLLASVRSREDAPWLKPDGTSRDGERTWRNIVPLWVAALAMLRACATPAVLDALAGLEAAPFHVRITVLQLVANLAARHRLDAARRAQASAIIEAMVAAQRGVEWRDPRSPIDALPPRDSAPVDRRSVRVDVTWQLGLAAERARAALRPAMAAAR
jgi:hypothetical protein